MTQRSETLHVITVEDILLGGRVFLDINQKQEKVQIRSNICLSMTN